MVTMLSTFPCCPPRVGNNQAGPPALSVRKAFPEAITTLPSNVVREHGECPHSSFSFHVIYLHNILAQRQTEHTFKYTECVRLPASGHVGCVIRGVRPGDGRPPHTNGYRTRHPIRFWVFRTYKISSHRSAETERTINLLMAGQWSRPLKTRPVDTSQSRTPAHLPIRHATDRKV
jgi:hypothetical protein